MSSFRPPTRRESTPGVRCHGLKEGHQWMLEIENRWTRSSPRTRGRPVRNGEYGPTRTNGASELGGRQQCPSRTGRER